MKRSIFLAFAILLAAASAYGQAWSGTIPTSRAIDWTKAGLPPIYPDGETTANPYTPPVRTKCGLTLPAGTSPATIASTVAGCASGTYVLLGPGAFTVNNALLNIFAPVTVRGSGPQTTFLNMSGNSTIQIGAASGAGSAKLTSDSSFSVGATAIKIGTVAGTGLVVGNVITVTQCDTGYTGTPCTGSTSDNGGLYVCGDNTHCMTEPTPQGDPPSHQQELFLVTAIVDNGTGGVCGGTHCFTLTLDHGLLLPNWAFGQSPKVSWQDHADDAIGAGLEDLTVFSSGVSTSCPVSFNDAYGSWVKGVRFIGAGANYTNCFNNAVHSLVMSNYTFSNVAISSVYNAVNQSGSLNLYLNNIHTSGSYWLGQGGNVGSVLAYGFIRDMFTQYTENSIFDHHAFSMFNDEEQNQVGVMHEDNTWGTRGANTYLRNVVLCADIPYTTWNPGPGNYRGIVISGFQRFDNMIGNAVGTAVCTGYQGSGFNNNFQFDGSDTLTTNSLMRWGNVTVVTQSSDTPTNSGIRFVSAEARPATLTGNAVPYQASVPGSTNLGCSYFLSAYTANSCTPKMSGGTGLPFYKVCVAWSSFPTCTATQTQPFPVAGPDITSGPYVLGHAYDNPAAIAWKNLPVDTTYQISHTVTASSWSGGIETLTFTPALPDMTHAMGAFQLSGLTGACTSGATFNSNNEILMTGSTVTTVKYALASDPGTNNCNGTNAFKFPDVREFDESVFQNDASGPTTLNPPTFSPSAGTYTSTQSVTLTLPAGSTGCYTTDGSDPAASTPGTCSHGTTYSTAISVSSSETIKALATEATFTNSSIASAAYTINVIPPNPPAPAVQMTLNITQPVSVPYTVNVPFSAPVAASSNGNTVTGSLMVSGKSTASGSATGTAKATLALKCTPPPPGGKWGCQCTFSGGSCTVTVN